MLSTLREVFPDIAIKSDQVIYRHSGVRPLPLAPERSGEQVNRDHSLQRDNLSGIPTYSMIGGKWTTLRAFSEEAATSRWRRSDAGAFGRLNRSRSEAAQAFPNRTRSQADLSSRRA